MKTVPDEPWGRCGECGAPLPPPTAAAHTLCLTLTRPLDTTGAAAPSTTIVLDEL